jgi:hypothetical protein
MIHPAPKPRRSSRKPSSPAIRKARPRARNAKRHGREWTRAYHSSARVAFVQSLPCLICGIVPSVCAHVGRKGAGASRKADYDQTVPLCQAHHDELHDHGVIVRIGTERTDMTFTKAGLGECCAVIEKAWQIHLERDVA